MILNYVKKDMSGAFSILLLKTAIATLLSVIAYKTFNFGSSGAYAILAGLFTGQALVSETLLQRLKYNVIVVIGVVFVVVITSSIYYFKLYYLQVIIISAFSAYTVYFFKKNKTFGFILLYLTIFNIISFGLPLKDIKSIFDAGYACLVGGCCSIIATLIIPISFIRWKNSLKHVIESELSSFCLYQYKLGFFEDYKNINVKKKNKLLNYHFSLILISNQLKKNGFLTYSEISSNVINGLILLSYWPKSAIPYKEKKHITKLIEDTFLLVSKLFSKHVRDKYEIKNKLIELKKEISTYMHKDISSCPSTLVNHIDYVIDRSIYLFNLSEK